MGRVVHFEIPADDVERTAQFYRDVFGWSIQKWDGPVEYWLIDTGDTAPGINGGMMKRHDPGQPVANTIAVEDLDATAAKIESLGGTVVVPKMEIPGIGHLLYFKDPEGNIFGAMQPKM